MPLIDRFFDHSTQLLILPPRGAMVPRAFKGVRFDRNLYSTFLSRMQRLRGRVYLEDGAILPQELTADGRHEVPIDAKSWHILAVDREGEVWACGRFLEETAARSLDDLWLRRSAIARHPTYGAPLKNAVESELTRARAEGLRFGELGGWAVSKEHRCRLDASRIVVATFALLQLLGGCIGLATATHRHGSAGILRRFGFDSVAAQGEPLPAYYDPQYDCEMEMLRFDSRQPHPKFIARVSQFVAQLRTTRLVSDSRQTPAFAHAAAASAGAPIPAMAGLGHRWEMALSAP